MINEVHFTYLGAYFIIHCGILFISKFEVYEVHACNVAFLHLPLVCIRRHHSLMLVR
jgi:hypothetical protein